MRLHTTHLLALLFLLAPTAKADDNPQRAELTNIADIWAQRGGSTYSSQTPMGSHFERFGAATDEDRLWLANPDNQPEFRIDDSDVWKAKRVTLYPYGTPVPADINQHDIGDCSLCSVLTSLAYIYPDYVRTLITRRDATTYTVKMFDPKGNPVEVVVDNKVLCRPDGGVRQLTGKDGAVTWATLLEKAVMKWETVFHCNGIGGIGTEHVAPLFTGNGESYAYWAGQLYTSEMQKVVDYALGELGMISIGGFTEGGLRCGELETVTGHAFAVMYTTRTSDYLWSMRNPWGNGDALDGVLEIPNDRNVTRTIDFRLVMPGAAAAYRKADLAGYVVPTERIIDTENPICVDAQGVAYTLCAGGEGFRGESWDNLCDHDASTKYCGPTDNAWAPSRPPSLRGLRNIRSSRAATPIPTPTATRARGRWKAPTTAIAGRSSTSRPTTWTCAS